MIEALTLVLGIAFVASTYKVARSIARPLARMIESRLAA